MDIKFEKTGNVSAKITLAFEPGDYQPKVEKTLKDLSKRAQMPGFRPGKVPMGIIRKMHGTQAKAEAINSLLQDNLFDYIKKHNIDMLGEPLSDEKQEPQDIEKQDSFTFVFDIPLAPEFDITLGSDDTVDYYDIQVSDEMVTRQLDALQQQAGHPEDVDSYEEKDILRGELVELGEDGQPKADGISVEMASIMPAYFTSDDQKKLFEGAKKGETLTFNPNKAYEGNEAELSTLLKINKDDVKNHAGDFSFKIDTISRFVPAELNQEFFDKVFGKDAEIKDEAAARTKIAEQIKDVQVHDSDYKFLLDVRAYAEKKVGDLEFPEDLLKRVLKANNKDKDEKFFEENFPKSIAELKWQLIKDKLVKANDIKVDDKDVKQAAINAARYQFAQYGMNNIPDEYLENYAQSMLKNRDQVNMLVNRCIDDKLAACLKGVVTLNHKEISTEDFTKMFEEA